MGIAGRMTVVSEKVSSKADKASVRDGSEVMSAEALCPHEIVHQLAIPAKLNGKNRKGQITSVHEILQKQDTEGGWTWRRVRSLFYNEVPSEHIKHREALALKSALDDMRTLYLRMVERQQAKMREEERLTRAEGWNEGNSLLFGAAALLAGAHDGQDQDE
jgi:hypothetical protein